jgi:hypothetical protein
VAGERADILFRAELDASGAITSLQAFKGEAGTASAQAGSAFGLLANQWTKMVAAMAAFAGGAAIVGFLKESVAGAMEAEDAVVKLDATLKATGYSAGLTGNQIRLFAREMSYLSGTTEEEIANAAALLTTFSQVRGEAFEKTIVVAKDLSALMGGDLVSATEALGRAMQDPTIAARALRGAHIILSADEKQSLKVMAEHNDVAATQAKILEIVKGKVEGLGAAMAGTLSGQLKTMANQWGELKEALGAFIIKSADLPGVTKFWTDFFTTLRKGMEGVGTAEQGWKDALTRASAAQLTAYAEKLKAQIESLKEAAKGTDHTTEAYRNNIAALMDAKAKLGEVTRELKAKTVAETAANEAARRGKDLTEEQAKALQGLLDKAQPLAKAEAEYAETMKLLNQAKATGEITTKQYADAVLFAARALADARKAGLELKPIIVDVAAAFKEWDAANPQKLPQGYSLTPWIKYYQGIADEAKKGLTKPMEGIGDESAKIFANAFKDGFLAVMEGKGFTDPMKLLFGGLAGMFAQMLGDQIQSVMSTGKIDEEALKKAGVLTAKGELNPGTAAMMLGGLLGTIGGAQGNRGLATFGGAISGAGAGFMMAGGMGAAAGVGAGAASGAAAGSAFPVWGTIIGAVIGAALAYMGSKGPSAESAQMGLRGGKGYVYEITGGVNKEAERQVAQAITARYQTTVMGFRDVLRKMEADLGKVPDVSLTFNEKTKNLQSAMDAFIKGTIPRAVFEAYKPALMDALTSLGVGADRMKEELANFTALDFDTAMAGFARWISVLVDITDVKKLLLKTPEEMRAEVNRTMREGFLAGFEDVMDRAAELAEGSADLFSKEQVANAENLIALGKQQYDTTLNYISQLESVSKNIGQLVSGVLLGFEEKRAATGGPESLGAFYQRQLEALQARLAGATSGEQVNEIMAQMAKFAQALGDLGLAGIFGGGAATPWGEAVVGSQEWVEQYLKQQQAIGDALIAEWVKEAADRNALLADVLEAQRLALVAATNAAGSLADGLTGAKDGLDDLDDAASDLAETLRDVREQLAGLAGAWTEAGEGGTPPAPARYA